MQCSHTSTGSSAWRADINFFFQSQQTQQKLSRYFHITKCLSPAEVKAHPFSRKKKDYNNFNNILTGTLYLPDGKEAIELT